MAKRWPRLVSSLGSRRSKLRRRWRRCCPRYPWASSDPPQTPEGLGNLFALMARQPDLYAAYDDPRISFSPEARDAGNAVLSTMFGSPDASRAIAGQAQQLSGISSAILKKLLPVIVGLIISGLMRSGSGRAAPQAPQPAPEQGGGLIDILRQIFQQGPAEATNQPGSGSSPWGIPPIGDILGTDRGGTESPQKAPPMPMPSDQPVPVPTTPAERPYLAAIYCPTSCANWRRRSARGV